MYARKQSALKSLTLRIDTLTNLSASVCEPVGGKFSVKNLASTDYGGRKQIKIRGTVSVMTIRLGRYVNIIVYKIMCKYDKNR